MPSPHCARARRVSKWLLFVLPWTVPARADVPDGVSSAQNEAPPERIALVDEARAAFVRGVELAKVGRWNEARTAFEESDGVLPNAVTKYNVGFCARALGLYARAEWAFANALAEDARSRILPEDLRASARTLLAESAKRRANASFFADADTRLLVDGRPLEQLAPATDAAVYLAGVRPPGAAELVRPGRVRLRLDPGMHVFQVTRWGRSEPAVVQTFLPGEARVLRFAPDPEKVERGAAAPESPKSTPFTWPVVALGSVGVAALATGTVFGVLSLTTHAELATACPGDRCNESHASDVTRLHTYEDVATTAFVVGGVALATAGVLLLTGAGRAREAPQTVRDPSHAGLRVGVSPAGVCGTF
ncbi:MAG TPA: hypothetical protein VHC69_28915 [Polyangiaceae bacterium]|nr:hypothetical protein [Polyangiaceae bacterium]